MDLGYSTGCFYAYDLPLKEKIRFILDIQRDAIEVIFQENRELREALGKETVGLVKKFKYRSLHAPVKNIKYPSSKSNPIVEKLLFLVEKINPQTVLFHPDLITDFNWLNQKFGPLLAFENMDFRKNYGKTIKDLEEVFDKSPQAKWVFDVNHLYTHNRSMNKANQYYQKFRDRFCHYHLSGYGGFHNCLCLTNEDIILKGIVDPSRPIISEGAAPNMKEVIRQEHAYILSKLKNQAGSFL